MGMVPGHPFYISNANFGKIMYICESTERLKEALMYLLNKVSIKVDNYS